MNSLDQLERFFLPFIDPLEKCNRMLISKMIGNGISIDISHIIHWSLTKSGMGGLTESNFILLNQVNNNGELLFNFNIYELPIFHEVPHYWLDPSYHFRFLNNKKMSHKLQMRMAYQKILLFPDENYDIKLTSGNMILNGLFNKEIPLPSEKTSKDDHFYRFTTKHLFQDILKKIKKHGLQIHITQSHIGNLRKKYNDFCEIEKTLQECTLLSINTIKEERYYLTNFNFYNNLFNDFGICDKSLTIEDFYIKILKLNHNHFAHFDFFLWLDFLISFSFMGENKGFSNKYKQNTEQLMLELQEKPKIHLKLLSYN